MDYNNKISLVIIPYFISDDIDLAEHIIKSLPSKVEKNKDKIIKILINYGRDSDELKPIRDKLASIEMKLLSNTYSGVNDKNQLIMKKMVKLIMVFGMIAFLPFSCKEKAAEPVEEAGSERGQTPALHAQSGQPAGDVL